MKKTVLFLAIFAMVSCGGKMTNDEIKNKIAGYKEEIASIQAKIKELELQMKDSTSNDNLKTVSVEKVSFTTFEHFIEIQGKLDGDNNVSVYPEAPGIIKQILVKEGQKVSAGQTIAAINSSAGREQIKALESQLKLATDVYNRQKALWDQNIGSEVQYLQAKTQKEALESQVSSVKKQLAMYVITAPVSGTIEELPLKIGQMVGPQFPVCKIVNFNTLKAKAEVAESYTTKINTGDKVKIYVTDLNEEISAQIDFCSRYINPINRTFTVEAHFEGNEKMKANMIAVVKINDYKSEKAIVVPINMIQTDQKGEYIFVNSVENNKNIIRKKYITIGHTYNGKAEIIKGLELQDKIISVGYLTVEEGEEVAIN